MTRIVIYIYCEWDKYETLLGVFENKIVPRAWYFIRNLYVAQIVS